MKYDPSKIKGVNHRDIESLHPVVGALATKFLASAKEMLVKYYPDFDVKIISTLRTWEEQAKIYEQGRTTQGIKVTNSKAGQSNHNWGVAFDIGIFYKGAYNTKECQKLYDKLGSIGEDTGLNWGGRWAKSPDRPHYQYTGKLSNNDFLAQVTTDNIDTLLMNKYETMEELLKALKLI